MQVFDYPDVRMKDGLSERESRKSRRIAEVLLDFTASTGPTRGPIRAIMAENACMGPGNGPVRALVRFFCIFLRFISRKE